MNEHAAVHEVKWHTSYWPLILSVGVLFLLPLSFAFYFVYKNPLVAVISLGIGAPLVIISIAGWVKEGFEDIHHYSVINSCAYRVSEQSRPRRRGTHAKRRGSGAE